jgi:CopG family transcriptional regulator / antitoxin EndoAI
MSKRINIVLPETTIQTIDRMIRRGQRSRFINQAVQHYVANRSIEALRAHLERAAVRDRDLDREIAADWFAVDHETWRQLDEQKQIGSTGRDRWKPASSGLDRRLCYADRRIGTKRISTR